MHLVARAIVAPVHVLVLGSGGTSARPQAGVVVVHSSFVTGERGGDHLSLVAQVPGERAPRVVLTQLIWRVLGPLHPSSDMPQTTSSNHWSLRVSRGIPLRVSLTDPDAAGSA